MNLSFLEKPQQLRLQWQRQITNLVEKQSSVLSRTDQTRLIRHRTGKRSAPVSKQHAFNQLRRNCRAVEGNELTFRAPAETMNRSRDQFLSGTRLASYQNR